MKKTILILLLALGAFAVYKFFFSEKRFVSVLVFSKTESFRHASIPNGQKAIFELGQKYDFAVDTTEDASVFNEKSLSKYNVVIFLSTTGDILNDAQQLEFNRFIQAGGGFVGIHAAADTEYDWPWYGKLVGAYFNGHPNDPNVRDAVIDNKNKTHNCCKHLPDRWECSDEWYNYKDINPAINVVLNLDEKTYEGGTNGENHPIAWYHEFDGGRSFYTGLGHTIEAFDDAFFREHLWGGIDYAAGEGKPVNYNLSNVAPEENRFVKDVLDAGLQEPMELEMLPDGRLLFIERRGTVKLYDTKVDSSVVINEFNVFHQLEDGLLGLTLDPDFKNNSWLYLFYSPAGPEHKQHVSRFEFKDNKIDESSEKVVLEISVQRDTCCHSAGSLEFGADGLLYISTGDNTNPHESDGYAPIDEQAGRSGFDAQKSSANPNDLRGKILRIKPQSDGSYEIPDGNLFAKDGSNGRPEIYVMGCRNPYRIAIDDKTGYLYWGDVGPDAGKDSTGLGPMGYDEVNQAKAAGFFGWPYFIGDNKPYHDRDFKTGQIVKVANDPAKPINKSPNNTGVENLPPAQPAYIWYPYGESKEFPLVGDGGRNAMAAGVYYYEDYPDKPGKYPEYYDGKLFTYDWMRGWIMATTMDEKGDLVRMERFLPNLELNNPVDIIFGPNGDFYLLEYGTNWFTANEDARLVHLKFIAGNRQPVAKASSNKNVGAVPLSISFNGEESIDYDGDDLKYTWYLNGNTQISDRAAFVYKFDKPGKYKVSLKTEDQDGEISQSDIEVIAGNDPPKLNWEVAGNRSFFWDNQQIDYNIAVSDTEDGKLGNGIDNNQVYVSIDYLATGSDANQSAMGHEAMTEQSKYLLGKRLMANSDCKSCHQEAAKSVGPTYIDIANKYKDKLDAIDYMADKIITGGGGVWGQTVMAAHPQLSKGEATQMSKYILSLSGKIANDGMPVNGKYTFNEHKDSEVYGSYIMTASYTDKGGKGAPALTAREAITLRYPLIVAKDFDATDKAMKFEVKAGQAPGVEEDFEIVVGVNDSYVKYGQLDLTNVSAIELEYALAGMYMGDGSIEIRVDAKDGDLLGSIDVEQPLTFDSKKTPVSITKTEGVHDLFINFKSQDEQKPVCGLISLRFLNDKVQ